MFKCCQIVVNKKQSTIHCVLNPEDMLKTGKSCAKPCAKVFKKYFVFADFAQELFNHAEISSDPIGEEEAGAAGSH